MFTFEKAFAKINLYLDVERKREDGYHDLLTVMQSVDLYDDVYVELNNTGKIELVVKNCEVDIPMEENIAYIAAKKYMEKLYFDTPAGVYIKITKNIPVSAGLGGGSSDAAAVLRGLNFLFGKPFTKEELCEIGLSIGSDVPYCIIGGAQICQGRGEVKYDLWGMREFHTVIVKADEKRSTAEQYRLLDEKFDNFKDHRVSQTWVRLIPALQSARSKEAIDNMYNIFDCLYDDNPTVQDIKRIMNENEAMITMIAGSGPSVFGMFFDCIYAEDVCEALTNAGYKPYVCRFIKVQYEALDPHVEAWKQ